MRSLSRLREQSQVAGWLNCVKPCHSSRESHVLFTRLFCCNSLVENTSVERTRICVFHTCMYVVSTPVASLPRGFNGVSPCVSVHICFSLLLPIWQLYALSLEMWRRWNGPIEHMHWRHHILDNHHLRGHVEQQIVQKCVHARHPLLCEFRFLSNLWHHVNKVYSLLPAELMHNKNVYDTCAQ